MKPLALALLAALCLAASDKPDPIENIADVLKAIPEEDREEFEGVADAAELERIAAQLTADLAERPVEIERYKIDNVNRKVEDGIATVYLAAKQETIGRLRYRFIYKCQMPEDDPRMRLREGQTIHLSTFVERIKLRPSPVSDQITMEVRMADRPKAD